MKRISLENIYEALRDMKFEVDVDPIVAAKARRAVERMVTL
jgi:quinolinate synthase